MTPGVFLTDLVYVEEGNESFLHPEGSSMTLINFEKFKMMHSVWEMVEKCHQNSYNFHVPEHIMEFTYALPHGLDDRTLYKLSLVREPRGR